MKAIWSAKWYVLLGLISYLVFLIMTAPLEYVWPKLQPYVEPLPVSVEHVQGTLWKGQALVNIPNVGRVNGSWDIHLNSLIAGKLNADVNLKGDELSFKGVVIASSEHIEVESGSAFLSSKYLKNLLQQGRSSLTGDFELNKFSGLFSLVENKILAADGRLLFTGGDVSFPLDGKTVNATLPILVGKITKPSDNVELVITNTDGQNIGDGYVQPDGWAGLGIRRRFLDILGLHWPEGVSADKVIFEASQKLL